jgi:hypothetical protein
VEKIYYFFAAIYQRIKCRGRGGAYFSLRMAIVFLLLLHLFNILLGINIAFSIDLMPRDGNSFLLWFFCLTIAGVISLNYILPLKKLTIIEITPPHMKLFDRFFMTYFFLCIIIMLFLIINQPPPLIRYEMPQ